MQALDTPVPLSTLAALMVAMAAKHYLIDFVAQTDWMARGKERVTGWAAPLAVHAGTHALAPWRSPCSTSPASGGSRSSTSSSTG